MDIILFGMQGSGKGTQGKLLADRFSLAIFETGAALRCLAAENSSLGRKVKNIIEAGHLVPNDVVMEIIEDFMKRLPEGKGVLFDGLPRSMPQKMSFDALMKKLKRSPIGILINISKEAALKRLLTRRICTSCGIVFPAAYKETTCQTCHGPLTTRTDDNDASIKNRLDAFEKETLPVIHAYQHEGMMINISGEQSIENVDRDIVQALAHRS